MEPKECAAAILSLLETKKECEAQIKALLQSYEDGLFIRVIGIEVFRAGKEIMEVKIKVDL